MNYIENINRFISGAIDESKLNYYCNTIEETIGEKISNLVPSITIRNNHPSLQSIIFLTAKTLGEIHFDGSEITFDYSPRGSFENIKVRFDIFNRPESTNLETATIHLIHSPSGVISTEISYAGVDRNEWIKFVKESVDIGVSKW